MKLFAEMYLLFFAVSISEMRKSLAMPRTSVQPVATQEGASSATGSTSASGAGSRAAASAEGGASNSLGALLQGFEKSLLEQLKQHLALLQVRLAQ